MSNSPLLKAPGSLVLKGQTDGQLVSWDSASGRYVPTSDLVVDPATGFVGVGTDTPTEELTVDGTLRLGVDVTGDSNLALFSSRPIVSIMESGAPTCKIILVNADSTGELNAPRIGSKGNNFIVETNDEEQMVITSEGNVGLKGQQNPTLDLEFNTGSSVAHGIKVFRDGAGSNGAYDRTTTALYSNGSSFEPVALNASGTIFIDYNSNGNNTGDVVFRTGSFDVPEQTAQFKANGTIVFSEDESASSTAKLLVESSTSTSSSYALIVNDSGGNLIFSCRGDGRTYAPAVYNQTTSSAANVNVSSSGRLLRSTSSRRYKRNVEDMPYGLNEAMLLRPVTYIGTGDEDGDKVHGGLIAEEVHDVGLTDFVEYNNENQPDALEYGNMVALAFKAIQELAEKVEQLESRL